MNGAANLKSEWCVLHVRCGTATIIGKKTTMKGLLEEVAQLGPRPVAGAGIAPVVRVVVRAVVLAVVWAVAEPGCGIVAWRAQ